MLQCWQLLFSFCNFSFKFQKSWPMADQLVIQWLVDCWTTGSDPHHVSSAWRMQGSPLWSLCFGAWLFAVHCELSSCRVPLKPKLLAVYFQWLPFLLMTLACHIVAIKAQHGQAMLLFLDSIIHYSPFLPIFPSCWPLLLLFYTWTTGPSNLLFFSCRYSWDFPSSLFSRFLLRYS